MPNTAMLPVILWLSFLTMIGCS